jgi:hypothetical protein
MPRCSSTARACQVPAGEKYSVNTAAPLVIGVGLPWLTNRAVGVAEPAFPMFPFKGTIRDVAIYKTVLADKLINTHAQNGQGKATE